MTNQLTVVRVITASILATIAFVAHATSPAHAAEVPSTAITSSPTDKVRMNGNYDAGTLRIRGYFDPSRSWQTIAQAAGSAGTGNIISPGLVCNGGTYASGSSGVRFSIGPLDGTQTESGLALPAYAFELRFLNDLSSIGPCTGFVTDTNTRLLSTSSPVDDAHCSTHCVINQDTGWPSLPPDWFPGGTSGDTPTPDLSCTRNVTQLQTGDLRITIDTTWSEPPPVATLTVSDVNGTTPTINVNDFPDTLIVTIPDTAFGDGQFFVTPSYDFGAGFSPQIRSCPQYVNLDDPDQDDPLDPDSSVNSGFGCPSGWGLLNPANLLDLGTCLFIPRETALEDVLGIDPQDAQAIVDQEPDSDTLWFPVQELGTIIMTALDTATVEDTSSCPLQIRWGEYVGGPGLPDWNQSAGRDIVMDFGSDGFLVNTDPCTTMPLGVGIIRWASLVVAAMGMLWTGMRFVRKLGVAAG